MTRIISLIFMALFATGALAVEPDETLDDPALEARAQAIGQELRCVVCLSQSIEDSEAPLAKDLRLLVRELLVEGASDEEVFDYVVERYGEFVLMKPRMRPQTAPLWLAPLIFLAFGGVLLFFRFRPRAGSDG